MKTICNPTALFMLMLCLLCFSSCDKNDNVVDLIDPSYKTLEISCGYDFEIPILTNSWNIESVQDISSGKALLDKDGNPLALNGNGKIEASNGWLTLTRNSENKFVMSLKENFDKSNKRKFIICINENGHRDYITVIQQAGTEYKLVKSTYKELEGQREIYTSNRDCMSLNLSNNTSEAVWKSCDSLFMNVVKSSTFQSDSHEAFDWTQGEETEINMPELIIDNKIYWSGACTYKKGTMTAPYLYPKVISYESKILVPPHSNIYLRGEVTYCKRICNYTLTIKNMGTGTQFEVDGTWTQIIPISDSTIAS